ADDHVRISARKMVIETTIRLIVITRCNIELNQISLRACIFILFLTDVASVKIYSRLPSKTHLFYHRPTFYSRFCKTTWMLER
ncbi:hypothetical protein ACFL0S_12840, partial [Thermodesulfobacteriota bacterium]